MLCEFLELKFQYILFLIIFFKRFFYSFYWICDNIASALCFGIFVHEVYMILAPWPEIEPIPTVLEGEVLTTGLLGKSL